MKKLIVLMVLLCSASLTFAAEPEKRLEVNKHGNVRTTVVSDNWRLLTEVEKEAYAQPGKEIPTKLVLDKVTRLDFFHYAETLRYDEVVVYVDGELRTIAKSGEVVGEKSRAIYKIIVLVAMFLMLINNIIFAMAKENLFLSAISTPTATASAIVAAFAFVVAALVPTAAAAVILCVTILAVAVAITDNNINRKAYKVKASAFWITAIISIL